jgi:two-component system, chemotaxis family, response regulator PixG
MLISFPLKFVESQSPVRGTPSPALVSHQAITDSHLTTILERLAKTQSSGCLQIIGSGQISWKIFLNHGNIIYATHSVEVFDRFERHLRRLSQQIPLLSAQPSLEVQQELESFLCRYPSEVQDYQIICWLVKQNHLNCDQAQVLIEKVVNEVMESYLLLADGDYSFSSKMLGLPTLCELDTLSVIQKGQQQLQRWQTLAPQIRSPFQRPYFFSQAKAQEHLSPENQQKLGSLLKGFSFRHLAASLNQDELELATSLHLLIENGTILLRDAQAPFDQLPPIPQLTHLLESQPVNEQPQLLENQSPSEVNLSHLPGAKLSRPKYKVLCIGDNADILNKLSLYLINESFSTVTIGTAVEALKTVAQVQPDLILFDAEIHDMDGYSFCRILRNYGHFKSVPILMLTTHTGLIDRARAKLAGVTDFMTKPFTQFDILKVVFKHLT